jgi:hypothetical protein
MRSFSTVSLVFIMSGCLAVSASKYVSVSGSDSTGTGAQGSPWATIQNAATNVAAGDTVICGDGKYTDTITAMNSGTLGSPITFIGTNYGAWQSGQIQLTGVSNVLFQGLRIGSTNEVYVNASGGDVELYSPSRNITWTNCLWNHQVGQPGQTNTGCRSGIYIAAGVSYIGITNSSFLNWNFTKGLINTSGDYVSIYGCTFSNAWDCDTLYAWGSNGYMGHCFIMDGKTNDLVNHADAFFQTSGENEGDRFGNWVFEFCTVSNIQGQIGFTSADENPNIGGAIVRNCLFIDVTSYLGCGIPGLVVSNCNFVRVNTSGASSGPEACLVFGATVDYNNTNVTFCNNFIFECGSDPANASLGWGVMTNFGGSVAWSSIGYRNNYVAGTSYAAKSVASGTDGINGGDPKINTTTWRPQTDSPLLTAGYGGGFIGIYDYVAESQTSTKTYARVRK